MDVVWLGSHADVLVVEARPCFGQWVPPYPPSVKNRINEAPMEHQTNKQQCHYCRQNNTTGLCKECNRPCCWTCTVYGCICKDCANRMSR